MARVQPYIDSKSLIDGCFKILSEYARKTNYVGLMTEKKKEFEDNFVATKPYYERIGSELKSVAVLCNVPLEAGKDVYYTVRNLDMAKGESLIKEVFYTNGGVPYTIYEISLKTMEILLLDEADETRKYVVDYITQLCNMRLFDKYKERYVADKDLVFSVMINPVIMTKLEVMLMQERNLEDIPGCRIQCHPGNKMYYKESSDESWKRPWLTSVENLVIESYIKPSDCEVDIFHQVTLSSLQNITPGSSTKELKKRSPSEGGEQKPAKRSKVAQGDKKSDETVDKKLDEPVEKQTRRATKITSAKKSE